MIRHAYLQELWVDVGELAQNVSESMSREAKRHFLLLIVEQLSFKEKKQLRADLERMCEKTSS